MRPGNTYQDMSSPSFEAHNESDKSGSSEESQNHGGPKGSRSIIVEASFDEGDGRGPLVESNTNASESRTSPLVEKESSRHRRGHVRNLSEHFYDATSLTSEGGTDQREMSRSSYSTSREVGQKHRRGISGDLSHPAEAHRRINSIGNSASVSRPNYSQERQHHRVDSGLDILTAVAGASREELEMAAGGRGRTERQPWEAPPPASSSIRRSPVELLSYDHSPNSTEQHPPPPPHSSAPPPRGHHVVYPTGHHHHHHHPPPPHYYGAPYPQHAYPPHQPPHYYPPPPHHYGRHMPPHAPHPGRSGYPVQYSRAQSPYKAPYGHHPMTQPSFPRGSPPEPIYSAREASERESMSPPVPVPSSHWQGGTTQGVQTVVTTIGVEDSGRTLQPSPKTRPEKSPRSKHHRKTSSLNSLVFLGETAEQLSKGGHHRVSSSTVSFLNGLDGLEGDAAFLHHLQASNGTPATASAPYEARKEAKTVESRPSPPPPPPTQEPKQTSPTASSGKSKLAPGGTSKRVRRKCTVDGCPNRVVQGGLCISHGAKRKQCKYPGCTKNVKKAGLCSTHGPARKRCEYEGCSKVAVQGGKCIAHGAKKKLCSIDGCTKQAILGGMCKKHHDHNQAPSDKRIQPPPVDSMAQCVPIESEPVEREVHPIKTSNRPKNKTRGHTRGLSIFQEMSADTVGNLLLENPEDPSNEPGTENQRRVYGMY